MKGEETCDICGGKRQGSGYGEDQCPTCGQRYSYDESERMDLTDEQLNLLRKHYEEKQGAAVSGQMVEAFGTYFPSERETP